MKFTGLTLCLFALPVVVWEPQIQVTGCHLVAWHSLKKQVIEPCYNNYVSVGKKKILFALKDFASLTR